VPYGRKKLGKWVAAFLLALIIMGAAIGIPLASVRAVSQNRTIPVGTVLYLWYGWNSTTKEWTGGLGSSHWNDSGKSDVIDHPDQGYYKSLDNNTLAYQLNQIKSAGFSFLLVSWWGWGDEGLNGTVSKDLNAAINNATLNLFRYLEAYKSIFPFKVALLVEPFNSTAESTPSGSAKIYGYAYSHYYKPYSDLTFNWQGYPLITSFNPAYLSQNYTFTYRSLGNEPNPVDWIFWTGGGYQYLTASGGSAQPQNYAISPVIGRDGEVSIVPKYDDHVLFAVGERPGYMEFDPQNQLGLYNYEWNYLATHRSQINLVIVYGWNEYHERTALECHTEPVVGEYCGAGNTEYYISQFEAYPDNPTTNPLDAWGAILPIIAIAAILGTALLVVVIVRRATH
jgi:hypothetical protein